MDYNGSGKISFYEALEYALFGSAEEAEIKLIAPATYLSHSSLENLTPNQYWDRHFEAGNFYY